jgi:hypothetical protein
MVALSSIDSRSEVQNLCDIGVAVTPGCLCRFERLVHLFERAWIVGSIVKLGCFVPKKLDLFAI